MIIGEFVDGLPRVAPTLLGVKSLALPAPVAGRRRLLLIGAVALIGLALALVFSAREARASSTVTLQSGTGCPVADVSPCSYAKVSSAITTAVNGPSGPTWLATFTGLPQTMTVTGVTAATDDAKKSIALTGTLSLPAGGSLPVQLTAVWGSQSAPVLGIAVKPSDGSLASLNSLWSSKANPTLSGALVVSTDHAGGGLDPATLPAAAQSFYPTGFVGALPGNGASLFAGINVGSTSDPALKNVLTFLGVGQTATIQGTLAGSIGPVVDPADATPTQSAGIALTLSSTSTAAPGSNLPAWLSSRTVSASLTMPTVTSTPAVSFTDTLNTTIGGQANTFTGTFGYDPAAGAGGGISATYGVASAATLHAPFGLGALHLSDAQLGISATLGSPVQFSGDFTANATVNTHTVGLQAHLDASGGSVAGNIAVTGSVSAADATSLGNELLGTSVTPDAGSAGSGLSLTSAEFSFASASGADKTFALTASSSFRGATADVLASITQPVGGAAKLFLGVHAANLSPSTLVANPSPALAGLAFPTADLFISKGYASDGQPTDVPTADMSDAQKTFFTKVYGTLPATISFGPNLTFDGTMTLPDTVTSRFGITDPVTFSGDLGFGLDGLGTGQAPAMSGSLHATLPALTAGLPDWISSTGPWTVNLAADSNHNVQLDVGGAVSATVNSQSYTATVSGALAVVNGETTFDLTGDIQGQFDNLFGLSWLSATNPTVSLHVEHGTAGNKIDASLRSDLAINGYAVTAEAVISNGEGTSAALSVTSKDSAATVGVGNVLSFFGGTAPDGLPSATLKSLSARVTITSNNGTSATLDVVADTSITMHSGGTPFDSTMLLQIAKPTAGKTTVVAGFRPDNDIKLSDFVSDPATDFTFPSLGILVATQQTDLKWANLLPAEQDFFQPFCGDDSSACHTTLSVASGISIVTATDIPDALDGALDQMSISHTAPVLATGTIPVFGQGDLDLHVALPAIPGTGPDFFDHGQLSLDVSTSGMSFNGAITFNVPKGSSASTKSSCTTLHGVWRTPRGGSSPACYDQVPFSLSAAIKVGATTSFTLTGGMQQGYHWVAPMGQSWLSLNTAVIQLGMTFSPEPGLQLGFELGATVANHDFDGSILAGLVPGGPTGVTPDLFGIRLASGSGLSAQDLVDLANDTGANVSLQQASMPNIAVRNVLLSFSQVDDPALCLKQGVHIAGDLYINPGDSATKLDSSDCKGEDTEAQNRATICTNDSENGCMVGVDVAVDDKGIHASGVLGGFAAGPLSFSGAKVDLEIGASVQHLVLAGKASINGFAEGSVDLLVGPTQTRFRGSAALFGSGLDAYLDGTANLNLQHLSDLKDIGGFNITAVLKSEWLNQAGVALSGTLSQLKPVVQTIAAIIVDLNNGDVLKAMFEIPTKAAQLGISLPAPFGPAFQSVSSALTTINNGIAALGHPFSYALNDVLNGFDLSFPGIPGIEVPQTCITTWDGGSCYTTPPWHTIFGTVPGIPGIVVPATCITTRVNGTCYSVPPIQGIHVPGICNALQQAIPTLTCDKGGIAEDLIFPALKSMLSSKTGVNLDNVSLSDVMNRVQTALGNGQTFSIDCAEFQASATIGSSPSASVSLSSHMNVFGTSLTPQLSWNFSPNSSNVGTAIVNVLDAIIHPDLNLNGTCALPADWDSNPDFPDVVGTGPTATTVSTTPVLPPPPKMSAQLTSATINEGDTAVLTGAITPAPSPAQQVTVDWGDGSTPATVTSGSDGHFSASHRVLNNTPAGQPSAQYNVKTTSGTGASALTSSVVLTVANVAPSNVTAVPSQGSINEGAGVTVHGGFSDPGADPHTVTVDWGDGHTDTQTLAVDVRTYVTPNHVYADNNGTQAGYPVTVTVTDDDLASGSASFTEKVANVAPGGISVTQLAPPGGTCPTAGCAATTPEQQAVSFRIDFTDPGTVDTETAVIDWGDGQSTTVPAGTLRSFSLTHVWTEADTDAHPDGRFPITVTVTDKDSGVGSGGATETVSNVAPTNLSACLFDVGATAGAACPTTATIAEGGTAQVQGNFTDVSAGDDHTVRIDWGPGWPTAERYQTIALPVGTFAFNATRQYGDEGTFPIAVTVADDDGASVTTTSTLIVTNVAPAITINRSAATTVQNVPAFIVGAGTSLPMQAHATDPGNDPLGVLWNWADGSTTATTWPGIAETSPENPHVAPQNVTDNHAHTWTGPCVYAMSVAANDGDSPAVLDQADAIVVGTNPQRLSAGWWQGNYKTHPTPTMLCQLSIVQRMSATFAGPASKVASAPVSLRSAADAASVLQPSSSDERMKLRREILTMWLDFSNGGFGYNQQLDTNGDGKPDTAFSAMMANAEAVGLNPDATQTQLRAQRQLLAGFVGD